MVAGDSAQHFPIPEDSDDSLRCAARLRLEELDDRLNPSGSVAIYDNNDGVRDPGTADTENFQEAADDYEDYYGSHTWADIITQLQNHVNQHGPIGELYIFDHGYSGGGGQQFGDTLITAAQFAQLESLMAEGGVIVLAGCTVGSGAAYCNAASTAAGVPVIASTTNVGYIPDGTMWGADYYSSGGTWETFGGPYNQDDLYLDLDSKPAPVEKEKKPIEGAIGGAAVNGNDHLYFVSIAPPVKGGNPVVSLYVL